MELVSAAKLKRFQKLQEQAAPYEKNLDEILRRLLRSGEPLWHPMLEVREEKKAALFVVTSDTGLCGSYNHDILEEAKRFLHNRPSSPLLVGIGKNGVNDLSRAGFSWLQTFTDIKTFPFAFLFPEINLLMKELFSEKTVDAIYICYSHFTSASSFSPITEKVLPLTWEKKDHAAGEELSPYLMEPSRHALFERLVPLVFAARIRKILLEASIAEHMARMNAMQQATDNAEELINSLVLLRNKIRQASITNELIEIVSGSKALKQ